MKLALCPLRMKVVSAKAASPSGAGSAAGTASISVGTTRRSSAMTAMAEPSWSFRPGLDAARRLPRAGGAAARAGFYALLFHPSAEAETEPERNLALRCEVVREVGQQLAAVLRHE